MKSTFFANTAASVVGLSLVQFKALSFLFLIFSSFNAHSATSIVGNLSVRGYTEEAEKQLFTGFTIKGSGKVRILIRGLAPSMQALGVTDTLANPKIQVFSGQSMIAENDDWRTASDSEEIISSGLAPTNSKESALIISLPADPYTIILSRNSMNNSEQPIADTGIGLLAVDILETDPDTSITPTLNQ